MIPSTTTPFSPPQPSFTYTSSNGQEHKSVPKRSSGPLSSDPNSSCGTQTRLLDSGSNIRNEMNADPDTTSSSSRFDSKTKEGLRRAGRGAAKVALVVLYHLRPRPWANGGGPGGGGDGGGG